MAQECADLLRERFGARRVIVFGSLVGPEPWHEGSDIDLAVEGLTDEQFWDAYGACLHLIESGGFDFNLVELETAPPRLRARILGEVDVPSDPLLALQQLIDDEYATLEETIQGMEVVLADLHDPTDPRQGEMRALASYVHDFYNGVEQILERIAIHFDKQLPRGENSYSDLLEQMVNATEGVRSAVISQTLRFQLVDMLGFRHVFRHVYGRRLIWSKLRPHVESLRPVLEQLRTQLADFFERQVRGS